MVGNIGPESLGRVREGSMGRDLVVEVGEVGEDRADSPLLGGRRPQNRK